MCMTRSTRPSVLSISSMDMSLEERGKLIEAMRVCAREHAEELAILAHEETGYGKVPHKIAKNLLAANKNPPVSRICIPRRSAVTMA